MSKLLIKDELIENETENKNHSQKNSHKKDRSLKQKRKKTAEEVQEIFCNEIEYISDQMNFISKIAVIRYCVNQIYKELKQDESNNRKRKSD